MGRTQEDYCRTHFTHLLTVATREQQHRIKSYLSLMGAHLAWDVPREIAVGGEFEMTGVLGPAVHNLNVTRLRRTNSALMTTEQQAGRLN